MNYQPEVSQKGFAVVANKIVGILLDENWRLKRKMGLTCKYKPYPIWPERQCILLNQGVLDWCMNPAVFAKLEEEYKDREVTKMLQKLETLRLVLDMLEKPDTPWPISDILKEMGTTPRMVSPIRPSLEREMLDSRGVIISEIPPAF
jgi:hypothetical protein